MNKAIIKYINLTRMHNDDTVLLFVLSILYVLSLILITVTLNSSSEYDEDSEISQRQLQEHPEWTRRE